MRNYPLNAYQNRTGWMWQNRISDTGGPTDAAAQIGNVTVTGTPLAIVTESQNFAVGADIDVGSTYNITLDGIPYDCVALLADTDVDVAAALAGAAAADPNWDVLQDGANVVATQKTPGAWTGTTSCSVSPQVVGSITKTVASEGANPDVVTLTDNNGNQYVYTVQQDDTTSDVAAGLANAIDGNDGYSAGNTSNVTDVENAVSVSFVLYPVVESPQGGDLAAVYATIEPAVTAAVTPSNSPHVGDSGHATKISLWLKLNAGTSFQYTIWRGTIGGGIAVAGAKSAAITADTLVELDANAVDWFFVELSDFLGGADVSVYAQGNDTRPGRN